MSFVGYLWVWAEDVLFGEAGRTFLKLENFFEIAWEVWERLSVTAFYSARLFQVRAVKKSCHAAPVFSHSARGAHVCVSTFFLSFRTKNAPLLCDIYCFCSNFQASGPPWSLSRCFVPNFHSLAALKARFKACLELASSLKTFGF